MTTSTQEYIIRYVPRGVARDLFAMRDPEIVLSGPAGTGKSMSAIYKVHLAMLKYPTARALMVRKTRRSLTESAMVTYWDKIRPDLDGVVWKSSVQQYQYPNGSILAVAGLDKPGKIMSSEWDLIYAQEATELEEVDWESCTIRLRNGKMPYQQIIGDCNPGPPTHWLKQRANAGKTLMLESRHEDNPLLFDTNGIITTEGQRYIGEVLDKLSGVRYARFRLGLWAAAEGMVYQDSWDRSKNLINRFPIPPEWPRYLSIDFGYNNPFVCLWFAVDPDGRLYCYRQLYKTHLLVEDAAKEIKNVSRWGTKDGEPLPRAIICDHDAEDRATLERHLGLYTIPAKKTVSDGIQAVATRLRPAGDGRPRLFFLRDSLITPDRDLVDRKKPTCFEEEIESYIWRTGGGVAPKEEPVKEDDHAADCVRYACSHLDLTPSGVSYFKDIWR